MAGSGAGGGSVGETKVIYHLDEEETPYLVKIPVPAERITLGDFKSVLQRPAGAKYFFKSMDQDFGVVKEEISDDNARLPCFNGRVVSWVRGPGSEGPVPLVSLSSSKLLSGLVAQLLFSCWRPWLFASLPIWREPAGAPQPSLSGASNACYCFSVLFSRLSQTLSPSLVLSVTPISYASLPN